MSTDAKPFWMLKLPTSIQGYYCWAKWIDNPSSFVREAHEEILQVIEYSAVEELKADMQKLVDALSFYENCTRLMIDVRDLPQDVLAQAYMENGDRARCALEQHKAKYGV